VENCSARKKKTIKILNTIIYIHKKAMSKCDQIFKRNFTSKMQKPSQENLLLLQFILR